jgi:phenylalanyl-tRNA synthetase beta chain
MRVSLNWLNEYIRLDDLSAEQVAEHLTDLGLEVEAIESATSIPDEVVVAKVVSAEPHPNADALKLCQVDCGEAEPVQIVCGAPNARPGISVALARVGAKLPGDFKIKKSKIRGEVSFGMMCSEQELGLGEGHDGIIEISGDHPLGSPASKALGVADATFEIGLTPNRADCLGVIGIARDLSAKLGRPITYPTATPDLTGSLDTSKHVKVEIEDKEGCSRFVALYIDNVSTVASPKWMQQRLESFGMRPINLIVDVTNYAMAEYGQPIHAYDTNDIHDKVIKVRRAKAGEKLTTLDQQERILNEDDLLICDGKGPTGLAGVMGGLDSEVKGNTKSIVVEVAYFAPKLVRKTARRMGLHTEASHRFERGVNISMTDKVALRVGELLQICSKELGVEPPKVAATPIDLYPDPVGPSVITLRLSRTRQLLAMPRLNKETIVKHLEALELTLLDQNEERMVFEVPLHRVDIEREVDLIEEVGRLEGFDKIPYQLPNMNIRPTMEDPFVQFQDDVRVHMAGLGFRETISFPFLSSSDFQKLGIEAGHPLAPSVVLANPISEDQGAMQTTLVANLLKAALGNRRHGNKGVRLFECGRAYHNSSVEIDGDTYPSWKKLNRQGRHLSVRARDDKNRPIERHLLAGILDQPLKEKSWDTDEIPASFFHGKETLLNLGRAFGIQLDCEPIDAKDFPFLHPSASAQIKKGPNLIGYMGELHPLAADSIGFGADQTPVVFEVDLEQLFNLKSKARKYATVMNKFPPATRDLAFIVDANKKHQDFENAIGKFKKKRYLNRYNLFDVYEGENVPEGKKSMAYKFYFQSSERTLTDKEVESEIGLLINWLGDTIDATQR